MATQALAIRRSSPLKPNQLRPNALSVIASRQEIRLSPANAFT